MHKQPLHNWEAWQSYCKDIPSPQSFIDWNFYFLIAASLQRRVWIGDESHQPLYPNIFVTLVGPPSAGKGISISPTNDALNHWKLPPPNTKGIIAPQKSKDEDISPEEMDKQGQIEAILMGDKELEEKFERNKKKRNEQVRLLIPMGANATTFESLTETIAGNPRYINYKKYDKLGKESIGVYSHCSLAIVLTDLFSLFKKQAENIVNLITDLYDCKPYSYKTKHCGMDYIQKGCINMLAGTTFSYMEQVFSDRILNEGYASRSFFLVETKPRFHRWDFGQLSEEQKQARQRILNYVKSLTTLYGEVKFSPEANEYLRHWWEDKHDEVYVNRDIRLEYYYGRKNIHVKKMAMVLHFSENQFINGVDGLARMEISLGTTIRTLEVLAAAEVNMHNALSFSSSNPLAKPRRKLLRVLLDKGQMTYQDICVEMWDYMESADPAKALKDLLIYMEGTEQLESFENPKLELRRKGLVYKIREHKQGEDKG